MTTHKSRPDSIDTAPADEDSVVLVVDTAGIARVTLNRPETANAMNVTMLSALHAALLQCHSRPDVRVVIVEGAGSSFCSGGDVKDFLAQSERLPSHIKEVSSWLQSVTAMVINLDVPVIAAVQGYAAGGGGLGLICSCDFVIAGRSAKFMSGAVRVGMIPDAGTTAILTQLVGLRKAMAITLTNITLDAEEALRIGLITRVAADEQLRQAVDSLAAQLLTTAPRAVAECKHLLWRGVGSSVADALGEEARAVVRLAGSADCLEGLAAVREKRPAVFGGT